MRTWYRLSQPVLEWISIGLLVLLIVAPLSIFAWLLFSTNTFTIQTITVVDARDHTAEAVREQIAPLVGRNILLVETRSLEQSTAGNIPQIRDIHIVRKLPSALKVVVQEKTPALLLLSGGKYHFVDAQGIAYEEARLDTLPGIVLPVIKNMGVETEVKLGLPAVNEGFVNFITSAQKDLPELTGGDVAEIRIPSLAAREVHFLLTNNWLIRLDTSRPLESQIDILNRLLAHTIPAEDHERIEYIDLRIPNRVYYKLQTTPTNSL